MPTRVCIQCGQTFTAWHGNTRLCSDACRRARTGKAIYLPRYCSQCGQRFAPTHGASILCSDACRQLRRDETNASHTPVTRPHDPRTERE